MEDNKLEVGDDAGSLAACLTCRIPPTCLTPAPGGGKQPPLAPLGLRSTSTYISHSDNKVVIQLLDWGYMMLSSCPKSCAHRDALSRP
jgi:hypothetical protein